MEERGEIFDAQRLWHAASQASVGFSNELAQTVRQLAPDLRNYASQLSGIVWINQEERGKAAGNLDRHCCTGQALPTRGRIWMICFCRVSRLYSPCAG